MATSGPQGLNLYINDLDLNSAKKLLKNVQDNQVFSMLSYTHTHIVLKVGDLVRVT